MITDKEQKKLSSSSAKPISRGVFLRAAGAAALGLAAAGCQRGPASVAPVETQAPTQVAAAASPGKTASGPAESPNAPFGVARGLHPGRVTWVHNPKAARWDGSKGLWWQEENVDQNEVFAMLSQALQKQIGESDDTAAWDALFRSFNAGRGKSGAGYAAGEKITIKINLNQVDRYAYQDNGSFTTPQLLFALLKSLAAAGIPPDAIAVYDAIRYIPDAIFNRCAKPELQGVRFVDWAGGQGREKVQRDPQVQVHWSGDVQGNPTYLPACLTEAAYLINLATLRGHNLAGVTLCAKNHFGTICADLDGKPSQNSPQGAGIHGTVAAHDYSTGDPKWTWKQRPMGTYNALVDLIGHTHLGEKTLLYVLDGLYVPDHQQAKVESWNRWQTEPFNGHWTSSLFVSQDNLAIDSVGTDFLLAEPIVRQAKDVLPENTTCDNYLHEASQAGQPPSQTKYDPDGQGAGLHSLGVHEHWNSPAKKQYSRDLGTGEGIELVKVI